MERTPLATYLKLCTAYYDLEQHPNDAQALAFYMHHACQAGGSILEPMCGTGRFLIPMLRAGLDVEGFDASPFMLDALRQKWAQLSAQKAPVWQQFIQDFTRDKLYRLIFIPYGSWGLITNREESKKGLQALYHHLQPGGKLIVEIETVASVPEPCGVWRRGVHTRADGSILALSFIATYSEQAQLFTSRSCYESIVDNKVVAQEDEIFEQYLYRIDEFDLHLQDAGFINIKKYPAFDKAQEVKIDSPIIIYECDYD